MMFMGYLPSPAKAYCDDLEQQPDIFNRNLLELTFNVIRRVRPSLALAIRNILADEYIEANRAQVYTNNFERQPRSDQCHKNDLFMIKLDAATIGQVVGALTQLGQESLDNPDRYPGKNYHILLLALIQKWSLLGEWLVQQNLIENADL